MTYEQKRNYLLKKIQSPTTCEQVSDELVITKYVFWQADNLIS